MARALVGVVAVALPVAGVVVAGRGDRDVTLLSAAMPEAGGWAPDNLVATVGQPLRLRLTSSDVVHGFAIGHDDRPPVDITPGVPTDVSLVFERPGTYTFYCTRWCGPNHWRMRGTIEVTGPGPPLERPPAAPYLTLGIDLDAPHPPAVHPQRAPSAARGAGWSHLLAPHVDPDSLRARSPATVWQTLRGDRRLAAAPDAAVWDAVAWIWREGTSPERLRMGRDLYRANCAACHGERGDGRGVLATRADAVWNAADPQRGHRAVTPADFTATDLLGASPALLHGKIVRGGMGTGMPYWGPVLSDLQLWAVVDYLWTFQFRYDDEGTP